MLTAPSSAARQQQDYALRTLRRTVQLQSDKRANAIAGSAAPLGVASLANRGQEVPRRVGGTQSQRVLPSSQPFSASQGQSESQQSQAIPDTTLPASQLRFNQQKLGMGGSGLQDMSLSTLSTQTPSSVGSMGHTDPSQPFSQHFSSQLGVLAGHATSQTSPLIFSQQTIPGTLPSHQQDQQLLVSGQQLFPPQQPQQRQQQHQQMQRHPQFSLQHQQPLPLEAPPIMSQLVMQNYTPQPQPHNVGMHQYEQHTHGFSSDLVAAASALVAALRHASSPRRRLRGKVPPPRRSRSPSRRRQLRAPSQDTVSESEGSGSSDEESPSAEPSSRAKPAHSMEGQNENVRLRLAVESTCKDVVHGLSHHLSEATEQHLAHLQGHKQENIDEILSLFTQYRRACAESDAILDRVGSSLEKVLAATSKAEVAHASARGIALKPESVPPSGLASISHCKQLPALTAGLGLPFAGSMTRRRRAIDGISVA